MKYQAHIVSVSKASSSVLRIVARYTVEYSVIASRDVSANGDGSKVEEYERRITEAAEMQLSMEATEANQQRYHVGKIIVVAVD